ncbi:hypothetical protein [Niastella vici]|uniref:hypothetical protein n=1 Tax=Niastella vici TaxID=1703345 RepID=UPI00117EA0C5|nr:hypothetical protein [Niastella vici]
MKKLHRDNKIAVENISKKGGCMSLCSNRGGLHPPFLEGLPDPNEENEEILIDCLANILVDIFLNSEAYHGGKEESCDLLPGINEGTG